MIRPEAQYSRTYRNRNPLKYRATNLVSGSRHRAKRLGIDHDLTTDWVLTRLRAGVCEACGLPFEFPECDEGGTGGPKNNWIPSLDRIDPCGGYTRDNVRVVVWCYNGAKASGTDADVLRLARALISRAESA